MSELPRGGLMAGKQGLASMSPEARQRIASLGGKAVQALRRAHVWTPAEASVAGKKSHKSAKSVGFHTMTPEARRAAGRKGGLRRWASRDVDAAERRA